MENNKVKVTFSEIYKRCPPPERKVTCFAEIYKRHPPQNKIYVKRCKSIQSYSDSVFNEFVYYYFFTPIGSQDRMAHLKAVYNSVKWI